ncbi:hypothetical protein K491DRAFT_447054 [Lophiostoma macrostomum CBS 122681]|uniref:Uncharacterized protein n=1 Tax=Lophiostoma macrostomum CBS 122681 TaxID=1314788 RepID=A0A6A6T8R8_9PLEO|nr:hypothetical protein K491DRAFT_447054 [Lophiostoma macrostomum CBS 122681]
MSCWAASLKTFLLASTKRRNSTAKRNGPEATETFSGRDLGATLPVHVSLEASRKKKLEQRQPRVLPLVSYNHRDTVYQEILTFHLLVAFRRGSSMCLVPPVGGQVCWWASCLDFGSSISFWWASGHRSFMEEDRLSSSFPCFVRESLKRLRKETQFSLEYPCGTLPARPSILLSPLEIRTNSAFGMLAASRLRPIPKSTKHRIYLVDFNPLSVLPLRRLKIDEVRSFRGQPANIPDGLCSKHESVVSLPLEQSIPPLFCTVQPKSLRYRFVISEEIAIPWRSSQKRQWSTSMLSQHLMESHCMVGPIIPSSKESR